MKTPIYIFSRDDTGLDIFANGHDACLYIEPPEVANENYFGFDSDGRPIEIHLVPKAKRSVLDTLFEPPHVIRVYLSNQTPDCDGFKSALLSRLEYLFTDQPELRPETPLSHLKLDEIKALAGFYFQ